MSDVTYTLPEDGNFTEEVIIGEDDRIWMKIHKKYHCYIGRWQSPHKGHRWLIDQHLAKGEPVLILIRDVPTDENNPFTATEVQTMLKAAFKTEWYTNSVEIQIIPDIASVNYGRGVGYDVVCHESAAPEHIKRVSATEIRRQIRAGEEGWREMVMPGVEKWLEAKFQ
jgi:nicotinamide mononucleotide adenylyltransferase